MLKEATGNPALSAHCLRHALKANSDAVNANQSHVAAIGGWAGKSISSHQMRYGREGLTRGEGPCTKIQVIRAIENVRLYMVNSS